jgi:hypothetical protein
VKAEEVREAAADVMHDAVRYINPGRVLAYLREHRLPQDKKVLAEILELIATADVDIEFTRSGEIK